MGRNIRIVLQHKQVSDPYLMMFKELRGEKAAAANAMLLQRKRKALKILKHYLVGGQLFADFCFSHGVLKPKPFEKRRMSVCYVLSYKYVL
jgi:hypothetical protein